MAGWTQLLPEERVTSHYTPIAALGATTPIRSQLSSFPDSQATRDQLRFNIHVRMMPSHFSLSLFFFYSQNVLRGASQFCTGVASPTLYKVLSELHPTMGCPRQALACSKINTK